MLSIVVPVYNEEDSLRPFFAELEKVTSGISESYEIICVDDGSTDSSLEILKSHARKDKEMRVFSFRRNLGKAEALTFGFMKSKGDYVVTLDADLQDKPSEIPKLLVKSKEGVEVVCGWRKNRKDKSSMVVISKLFNSILRLIFDVNIHDYNCGLKIYSREAAKNLYLYGGLYRFIPLLAYRNGFTVEEVEVEHDKRKFGKSKYGFSKIFKDLPDIFSIFFLTKYSERPLHFFGIIGSLFIFIGIVFIGYLTILHYAFGQVVGRRPLLFMGMLFVISGFQIFFTGFLADLMINISHAPELLDEKNTHFPLKYQSDKS